MKPVLDKDTETIDPHSLKLLDLLMHKTVEGIQQKSYKPRIRALSITTDPKKAGSLIAALAGSSPPWGSERRKPMPGPTPSSGMTIFSLKIHFPAMKKMKNSHPQVQ